MQPAPRPWLLKCNWRASRYSSCDANKCRFGQKRSRRELGELVETPSPVLCLDFHPSLSVRDEVGAYSAREGDDVNIPSRALDSRANSIGLTPPCSCGTCPRAPRATSRPSACLVLSDRASSRHAPPRQSLTRVTGEEQSDAQDQRQPGLFPGVWPPSNMFPAWRRGRRSGRSTVVTLGGIGQMSASCWMLLAATCILSAQAQGKMRNSDFFVVVVVAVDLV